MATIGRFTLRLLAGHKVRWKEVIKMVRKVVLLIGVSVVGLWAHGPGTHLYVGSQTFEVWENYDPEFYSALHY